MPKDKPEGYHSVTPSLVVRDARKAIDFYKKAFGARERFVMPGPDGKGIMHAEIQIGDSVIMLGEENPAWPEHKSAQALGGSPVGLHIYLADCDAAYEKAVAAGAKGEKAPEDAFWGDRYAMVKDPFGYGWGLLTHKKDLTPEQMRKAGEEWMASQALAKK